MSAGFKIEAVVPHRVGQFLFVQIVTEDGLTGLGESGAWGHLDASEAAIRTFGDYLRGQTANAVEHHWNVMHRSSYFQGAAINGAISAIDVALWDLKGQALGVPIYELLGGPVRSKLRLYGHAYDRTIAGVLTACRSLREDGFTAIGHLNPFLDEDFDTPLPDTKVGYLSTAKDNVERFRDEVGHDCDLLVELHRRLSPAEALTFAESMAHTGPMWLEDPIRPENLDAMSWLAQRSPIPIATGERFINLQQFQMLFVRNGAQYARTSLGVCGGITGGKKIAAIAEAHGVDIAPHCPLSPVTLAASMHLSVSIPNFAILEFPTGLEGFELRSSRRLLGQDVVDWAPRVEEGYLLMSDRPGLGVRLVDDAQARRPVVTRSLDMRLGRDGAPVDQ